MRSAPAFAPRLKMRAASPADFSSRREHRRGSVSARVRQMRSRTFAKLAPPRKNTARAACCSRRGATSATTIRTPQICFRSSLAPRKLGAFPRRARARNSRKRCVRSRFRKRTSPRSFLISENSTIFSRKKSRIAVLFASCFLRAPKRSRSSRTAFPQTKSPPRKAFANASSRQRRAFPQSGAIFPLRRKWHSPRCVARRLF